MASKRKLSTPSRPAPQSREECAAAISTYGLIQAQRQGLLDEMNAKTRAITQQYEQQLADLDAELKQRHLAIQTWCEPHRADLADSNGVKYIEFTTGRVEWRKDQDKITTSRDPGNIAQAIHVLRERGLDRFVRVIEEINKEAMLAEKQPGPESDKPGLAILIHGIPGLNLVIGKEAFHVKPLEINPS